MIYGSFQLWTPTYFLAIVCCSILCLPRIFFRKTKKGEYTFHTIISCSLLIVHNKSHKEIAAEFALKFKLITSPIWLTFLLLLSTENEPWKSGVLHIFQIFILLSVLSVNQIWVKKNRDISQVFWAEYILIILMWCFSTDQFLAHTPTLKAY